LYSFNTLFCTKACIAHNAYLFFSPENIHMDSSLTTSSELVLPSPTKVRMRKSRHRRGSKGSLSSIFSSPAKSPTKDALHEELHAKQLQLQRADPRDVSPGVFKYLGPGTAVREYKSNDEHEFGCHKCSRDLTHSNLNDVCFGCEGGCSDNICSSQRSSKISLDNSPTADTADTSTPSPITESKDLIENQNIENINESKITLREKDSNENLNCSFDTDTGTENLTTMTSNLNTDDNTIINTTLNRKINDPRSSPTLNINSHRLESMEPVNVIRRERKLRSIKVRLIIDNLKQIKNP
jgi:mitogen-activated protein kinase kinase kinase 13